MTFEEMDLLHQQRVDSMDEIVRLQDYKRWSQITTASLESQEEESDGE